MHLGGAAARRPAGETAVGNHTAEYVLNMQGAWEPPAEDDAHIAWARDFWSAPLGIPPAVQLSPCAGQAPSAGRMFWLERNRLSASHFALMRASPA